MTCHKQLQTSLVQQVLQLQDRLKVRWRTRSQEYSIDLIKRLTRREILPVPLAPCTVCDKTSPQTHAKMPRKKDARHDYSIFVRDLVLLTGPEDDTVPRQTTKVLLSESGHVLSGFNCSKNGLQWSFKSPEGSFSRESTPWCSNWDFGVSAHQASPSFFGPWSSSKWSYGA